MAKGRVKVSMDYDLKSHIVGKIWMALAMLIFFAVPTTICLYFDVKPDMSVMGTIAVIVPFLINFLSGVFEPIIYSPMLGINSAYLAFITGNLSNLKIPCVVKAQEIYGRKRSGVHPLGCDKHSGDNGHHRGVCAYPCGQQR